MLVSADETVERAAKPTTGSAEAKAIRGVSPNREMTSDMIRFFFRTALIAALAYLTLAAYAGYRVARGIDEAKASSLLTRVGAHLMGRDAIERIAIERGHVPQLLTASPTFWIVLHATE